MTKQFEIDKLYNKAYDFLITYGPRVLVGLVLLFVGFWLIRTVLNWSQQKMHRKQVDPTIKPFLISLIGVALRVMLILAVMGIIGIPMTPFNVLVGGLSVAAGLALAGNLQNFASGVVILLLKPFSVGDNLITQGLEGTVTSIQIFYTIITTFDNRTVIVPNSQLSNQVIINTSREGTRRLDINYKLPNSIDIKQAKSIVAKSLDNAKECLTSPEKRVGVGELLPDGYILAISVWVNAHGFTDTKLSVQERILQDIKDAGIKIPGL